MLSTLLSRRPRFFRRVFIVTGLGVLALVTFLSVRTYLRAPVDSVWPPRLDTGAQSTLPTLPDASSREPFSLVDIEQRPGLWIREGTLLGLQYVEVVIGETDPDAPLPLLVALHGRGDRPRVPGAPFDGLGRPVRVVLPAGPDRLGDGFQWLPFYVRQGRTEELAMSARAMSHRLAGFLRAFMEERPTFGRPLVSGFSQGGIMTWALTVSSPELLEASFPIAALIPPSLWPVAPSPGRFPPIRAMHGEDDETVPLQPAKEAIDVLVTRGLDVELEVFPGVAHYTSRAMANQHGEWLREALDAMYARLAPPTPDAGVDAGPGDGGLGDAGLGDGGLGDGGPTDAGSEDAGFGDTALDGEARRDGGRDGSAARADVGLAADLPLPR